MKNVSKEIWIVFILIIFVVFLVVIRVSRDETVSVEKRNYVSTDVEECTRIQILCVSDRKYFSDQTGCGCELKLEVGGSNFTYCPEESRNADACIEIYQPVCGFPINKTFSNSCFACMDENIIYYAQGECSE